MDRVGFKMYIKEGFLEEYRRRHNEIWPELVDLLKNAGIEEYSIFIDVETNTLFAFQKTTSNGGSQDLGREAIVQKWWDYMADIMEVNPDNSPISKSLEEVFYLE